MKGFTLIETMVAVFVLAVGIAGVLYMFPLGARLAKSGQMSSMATALAQAKMEEEISRSYDELSVATTTEAYGFDETLPAFKRETNIVCVDPNLNLSEVVDCSPDPGIKKIKVTVFWKSPLGVSEKSINLVSLIAKR